MFSLICSQCGTELQVPNSLAGCRIRCHDCDGVTHAPQIELTADEEGVAYTVQTTQETPQHKKEIEAFVKAAEDKAREEAERKPYYRRKFPVDLIAGILLTGGGGLMLLRTLSGMVSGGGGMDTISGALSALVFGVLLPLGLIISGAICLKCWMSD